jgi:hypothetical protein
VHRVSRHTHLASSGRHASTARAISNATALKRVYPTFHKERHTMTWAQFAQVTGYERSPAEWVRVAGLDLGTVFAYGLAAIDPDDRWWWIGEFYDEGQLSTKQRGEVLRNRLLYWDGLLVIADPAQKQERQDLLVEARVVTQTAIKDVMLGIAQVRKKLEIGPHDLPMMIMITEEMPHLIAQMEDYSHPLREDGLPDLTQVIKQNDHACDFLRYATYSYEVEYKARGSLAELNGRIGARSLDSAVSSFLPSGLFRKVF